MPLSIKFSELQPSFDWRSDNVITPVKNQDGSGGCVAYASVGAFEADIRLGGGPICTRDRALEIRKMRGTEHSNQLHFFDITGNGIEIKKMPEMPRVPKSGKTSF